MIARLLWVIYIFSATMITLGIGAAASSVPDAMITMGMSIMFFGLCAAAVWAIRQAEMGDGR